MKINRATRCSLKFATAEKRKALSGILAEYGRVVNGFIEQFWLNCPAKAQLLKPIVDSVPSWFSARLRKVAAREAIDMVKAAKERWGDEATKPTHRGQRMCVSSTIARLEVSKVAGEFDCWLHLSSIGNRMIMDLPIKLHKQFHKLSRKGTRLESYVITRDSVQFCFEIETGTKHKPDRCVGIDTGINALCSTSDGRQLGLDVKFSIERIKRCKHGSRGQKRAVRALRQRMDEVAKEISQSGATLVVVENLKNITKNTKKPKRRLGRNMRRSIGRWNVRYWLTRLEQQCEWNRVSFRTVSPWKTSQTCPSCGHVDRRNRNGEKFKCQNCDHSGNADVIAAGNILQRFLTGPYGAGCKPMMRHSEQKCHILGTVAVAKSVTTA